MASNPNRSTNLVQPVWGCLVTSMTAEPQPGPWQQVFLTQVKIDEELVSSEGPPFRLLCHQGNDTGVHDVQLHVRMRQAVGCQKGSACAPVVPDQAFNHIESSLLQELSGSSLGSAHNQLQDARIFRRLPDLF
jgi:hypothetical protein